MQLQMLVAGPRRSQVLSFWYRARAMRRWWQKNSSFSRDRMPSTARWWREGCIQGKTRVVSRQKRSESQIHTLWFSVQYEYVSPPCMLWHLPFGLPTVYIGYYCIYTPQPFSWESLSRMYLRDVRSPTIRTIRSHAPRNSYLDSASAFVEKLPYLMTCVTIGGLDLWVHRTGEDLCGTGIIVAEDTNNLDECKASCQANPVCNSITFISYPEDLEKHCNRYKSFGILCNEPAGTVMELYRKERPKTTTTTTSSTLSIPTIGQLMPL